MLHINLEKSHHLSVYELTNSHDITRSCEIGIVLMDSLLEGIVIAAADYHISTLTKLFAQWGLLNFA